MTYTDKSGVARTNGPVQFGRVFLKGEIAGYPQVKVNGSPVMTQANVLSRWSDGSAKHAVVSFLLASVAGNGSAAFTFQNQSSCNCGAGSRLTKADMLSAAYDFDATITVGSTIVSAKSILSAWDGSTTSANGPVYFWNDGLVSTTVVIADHSAAASNDITVNGHPSLRPIFIATFWPTINKVRVRFVLDNTNSEQLQNISYNAVLKTGSASPATIYTSTTTWPSGIPQDAGTRWSKVAWVGTAPDDRYNLDHNLAYMSSTAMLPNFDTTKTVSGTQIAADLAAWNSVAADIYKPFYSQHSPSAQGITWTASMGDPGGRPDIGPFPSWVVRWLWTGDYRERQISLLNADLLGNFPVHYREGSTGKFFDLARTVPAIGHPVSISARPTLEWYSFYQQQNATGGDKITPVGTVSTEGAGTFSWDQAHTPDTFFIPYLLTGDYFYLDQERLWTAFGAAYPIASLTAPWGRGGGSLQSGEVYMGQPRAEAWGLRDRTEATWIEPDGTPEKALFTQWMATAIGCFDGLHGITSSVYNGNGDWTWGNTVRITSDYETDSRNSPRTIPVIPGHGPNQHWYYGAAAYGGECQAGYGINDTVTQSCISQFELAYLGYSLGRTYELGFPTDKLIAKTVGAWYVAVTTDPGYNPNLIASGRIPIQKLAGNAYYSSMADLLTGFWPDQTTANTHGDTAGVWANIATLPLSDSDNGYDFLGSAAIAMTSPLTPGGTAAWAWAQTHIASSATLNDNPKWAILPRMSTAPPSPSAPSCDQNGDGKVDITDVQSAISQASGASICGLADLQQNRQCDVVDVQRVVSAALGQPCRIGP